jgi:transcriptional regulator with XRE-family HTH domain
MYFTSNIKLLRKRKERTQDEVALALEMKRSTYSGYENNVAQPDLNMLIRLSRYYGVSIDTLVRVDLEKLSESQLSELLRGNDIYIKGSGLRVLATTVNLENEENIEVVNERAKAGYATGYADPEFLKTLPVFQLPFLSRNKKYRAFQIKGDSMLPIPEGSWVTGEFIQDWSAIITGHAYVVFTIDDGIVFKIAENQLESKGVITLYSLNPFYEPFDVPVSGIKEVWKFVNYISSEIPDPVLPKDDLIKTVVSLKQDVERLKAKTKRRQL